MHSSTDGKEAIKINRYAWLIFSVIAVNYFLVFFHRVSPAVMALLIKEEFATGATTLGWMSSTYFYTYAAIQPVVGYLVDRWGPRKTVVLFTLIAFLGSAVFGLAPDIWMACFGRALIGLGVGGVYVPGMALLARWFLPERFATVNGLFLASGSLGGMVAATPLAWLSGEIGWRPTFQIIAGATLLLALIGWLVIRDRRPDKAPVSLESKNAPRRELTRIGLDFRQYVIVSCLLLGVGGTGLTFQGLWGYPFLLDVMGMGSIEAGNVMMLLPLGFVIGAPVVGRVSDWYGRRKPFLILAAAGFLGFWLVAVFVPRLMGCWALGAMIFVLGVLFGSTVNLSFTVIRLETPAPILGRVLGWVNPFAFVGVAVFQVMTGWLMDRVGKADAGGFPPEAYRSAFMLLLVVSAFTFLIVFVLREPRAKDHISTIPDRSADHSNL